MAAASLGPGWRTAGPTFSAAQELVGERSAAEVVTAAQERLAASRASGDRNGEAAGLVAEARGYFAMEMPEKALSSAVDARRLLRELGLKKEEAACLLMIADLQLSKGLSDEALRAAREALDVARQQGDGAAEDWAQLALVAALLMQSRCDEALRAASGALSASSKTGDKAREARAQALLARVRLARGEGEEAMRLAEAASLALSSPIDQAPALGLLAEAWLLRGEAGKALEEAGRAATAARSAGDLATAAGALATSARAQGRNGDRAAALAAARESLQLARQAGDQQGVRLAREACAEFRAGAAAAPPAGAKATVSAGAMQAVPGVSGPASLPMEPCVSCQRVCGTAETKKLSGMVAVVTGASRGVGKGIAHTLAEAGAIVYVTGRSSSGNPTDPSVPNTVDDTAASFGKLGGVGVAVHADHSEEAQSRAVAQLVQQNHGRVDLLVNNSLAEGTSAGASRQAVPTELFAPSLRRGRGVVVNLAGQQPQQQEQEQLDKQAQHAGQLQARDVHTVTLSTGLLKSERAIAQAEQTGAKISDMETTRFSGQAVVGISSMRPDELARFASSRAACASADVARFELDGFVQQRGMHALAATGRTALR